MLVRPRKRRVVIVLGVVVVLVMASWRSWGRTFGFFEPFKPWPNTVNMRYGPHDRNVLDLWKANPQSAARSTNARRDILSRWRVSKRRQVARAGQAH